VLVRAACYVVIVWEMTFIFLVWRPFWRSIVLAVGVLFHFMTVLTLGLMIFPMVCFTCYLSFVDETDVRQIATWWRNLCQRRPRLEALSTAASNWTSQLPDASIWRRPIQAGAVAFLAAGTAAGVALEHWLDLYGERRPEGRYQLKPIDESLAQRLVAPPQPIRDVDKFFAIDTGTLLVGDLLVDRRRVFRHGDRLIAQCNLIPPHEDMWVECKIKDPDNRLVDRVGNVVLREQFRANFMYPISKSLEPGTYTLVFETAGREVLQKRIEIVADSRNSASAN
jgi:hypothetical protein